MQAVDKLFNAVEAMAVLPMQTAARELRARISAQKTKDVLSNAGTVTEGLVAGLVGLLGNIAVEGTADLIAGSGTVVGTTQRAIRKAVKNYQDAKEQRVHTKNNSASPLPLRPASSLPLRPASSLPLRPASSLGRPAPRPMGSSSKPTYHQIGNQNQ